MLINYFTLLKVSEEIDKISDSKLIEIFTQEKDSIILVFFDGKDLIYLNVNLTTKLASIGFKSKFNRAKINTTNLFNFINGQILLESYIHHTDRFITLVTSEYNLIIAMFGGGKNNLIITDKSGDIVDSFKEKSKLINTSFLEVLRPKTSDEYTKELLFDYFLSMDPRIGKYYLKEFFETNGLQITAKTSDFKIDEILNINTRLKDFIAEIADSSIYYIYENDDKYLLSLIELSITNQNVFEFSSISSAIEKRLKKEIISSLDNKTKNLYLSKLLKLKGNLSGKILSTEAIDILYDNATKYKYYGELLMNLPNQKERPGKSIIINDSENNPFELKLSELHTINENAQRYYRKHQNTLNNIKHRQNLLPDIQKKLNRINKLIFEINNLEKSKEIEKIMVQNKDLFSAGDQINDEPTSRFRQFDLGEGYILYVGKNAANNDELTMKFAKANDLWLHARGSSGSHAVLRLNKEEKPPKYILQKAASITAYYSGAKNAKYTPVCYTFKKYVHKPKGANPGSVVISREEVIMAEPKLPV